MTQRMIQITSPIFIPEGQISGFGELRRAFAADRPLALEIGCGIGDFLVQMAGRHPELNFLGIDIYNKGCYKTCRKVEAAGLTNVRVLRQEARHLLENFLATQSLEAVFINCPDPWPKKRHRRRRLVGEQFLALLLDRLRPGGEFFFSSDFEDYAADIARALAAGPGWENRLPLPYAPGLPDYPLSKYMRRFLDQGESVHFLHWQRARDLGASAPACSPTADPAWESAANE